MSTRTYVVDGGCIGRNPSGEGVYFSVAEVLPGGGAVHYTEREINRAYQTNNHAEYLAVEAALGWVLLHGPERAIILSDSKLVVEQLNGRWGVHQPDLQALHRRISALWVQVAAATALELKWHSRKNSVAVLGH